MSKQSKSTHLHPLGAPLHGAHVIVEREHDAYRADHKLPEPTVCPECRAVYHAGRWQWGASVADAHQTLCPACRRIHDAFPAGYLTIGGAFFRQHRDELMRLVEHRAEHAKAEHPLQRVMEIQDTGDGVLVTMILPPRNVSLEKWFNSIKENEDEEQDEASAVHTGV